MKNSSKGSISLVGILIIILVLAVISFIFIERFTSKNNEANTTNTVSSMVDEGSSSTTSNTTSQGQTTSPSNVGAQGIQQTNNLQSINCTGVTGEKIKIQYPNGGEIFQMGQQITIRWDTCNASTGQTVTLGIGRVINTMGGTQPFVSFYPFQTANDGSETVTLSGVSTNGNWPFTAGVNYIVSVALNPLPSNTQETPYIQDSSDAPFKIQ